MALSKLSCKAESVMESMRNRRSEGWPVVAVSFLIAFTFAAQGCGDSDTSSSTGDAGGTSTSSTGGEGGSTTTASSSGGDGSGGATTSSSGGGGNTTTTGGGGEGGGTTTSTGGNGGAGGGTGGSGSSTSSSGGGGSGGGCNANETDCNGTCVSNDDPAYGCGTCTACGLVPNALVGCAGFGQCTYTCDVDRDDCDGQGFNGCEVDLNTDNANCGFCANDCSISEGNGSTCDGSGACTPAILDISCAWDPRDSMFDAMKIDGTDIQLVGGITGTAANDIYVSIATYSKGAIGHWNGSSWVNEALPSAPNVPTKVGGLWAVDANTVYATGADVNASRLFVRTGGVWSNAANAPSTIEMVDVTGTDANNVWILGQDAGVGMIWKKSGATWTSQSLPALPFPHALGRIWALDANNVFATGYHYDINSSAYLEGLLVRWNGSSWTKVTTVPSALKQISAIHGTSVNDLFVTGTGASGQGLIYHVTSNLATWTNTVSDASIAGYGPVWSKYTGAFVSSGYHPPSVAGSLRVTTGSMMSPPTTNPIDNMAYSAVGFWPEPGSDKVHFVHIGAPNLQLAGHYVGTCN